MELRLGKYRIQIEREYDIDGTMPKIYNAEGHPLETYFIKNRHSRHAPFGHEGKYFFWDRYNYGLDTHFYGPEAMTGTLGKPAVKYGMLTESRTIVPKDYEVFHRNRGLEKDFRYIFTYDDRILNEIENARFYPVAAGIWNSEMREGRYREKDRDLSILSSDKVMCALHRFRLELARLCKREGLADTFGRFDGGGYVEKVDETLNRYRFSMIIENDVSDYYFSERLTSCFAAQTVPVYLGARRIGDFFNTDGMILLGSADLEEAESLIAECTRERYEAMLPAVLDNYERVKEYVNMQDYLYEHYLMKA
ncbi:MAG: hypothetical protein HFI58_08415 [Lachnospiraceae bacterium]|jgi:hypothetical protein|nr:hypothetical protein [Lachnospiraceae bacterium]MCI8984333.1 hypothetical protein [Lachnospiraceae bacterium]MCI9012977.1 hypothetical protein [Lachnospiraceae bacterium]MCI9254842.1 hypothetical protein [Lachnospiraceae bacterium]